MKSEKMIDLLGQGMQEHFDREGKPMGFKSYLKRFLAQPAQQCRGAAHYIRDTFDHFGVRTFNTPAGKIKRYNMFDLDFDDRGPRVAGQEAAQRAIYRLLNNFVREGRVNRLILLHGPNGSAKTSLIRAIVRGMEHYAATDEGALFRFRWLFPTEKIASSSAIGFGGQPADKSKVLDTFANLPGDALDAVLECEMKDHPLLLLPKEQRRKLFSDLKKSGDLPAGFPLPDYLLHGELCSQCRLIHDSLLASYGGDIESVLRHIQVVRLNLSGRYRRAVATVEPQMHVDAGEQQLTASRGLASLPRAIAHLDLFQPRGPLVDANRGLLEYNDLLKKHIDTFKYLLVTCESSQVTLERSNLFLDTVFFGSTNEMMLDSFKEYADFASFKGRLELVRVPYLRRFSEERLIYEDQIPQAALGRHLSAHTLELAAVWAVMTRLRKPGTPEEGTAELKKLLAGMSPLDKAILYDRGTPPAKTDATTARELDQVIGQLYIPSGTDYEGRSGASPREVRMLLMNSAQQDERPCISPLNLFAGIKALIKDKTVFAFLQREAEEDYLDQEKILAMVEEHHLDLLEAETSAAMGLVSEASYRELFDRYIQNVSHWLRKETLTDPVSGNQVPPSEELMKRVEKVLAADEDAEKFRKDLISRIGAFALESEREGQKISNPPDYSIVFPVLFERMREDFMADRRQVIQRHLMSLLSFMDGQSMEPKAVTAAEGVLKQLYDEHGYCEHCAKEALAHLMKNRFSD